MFQIANFVGLQCNAYAFSREAIRSIEKQMWSKCKDNNQFIYKKLCKGELETS